MLTRWYQTPSFSLFDWDRPFRPSMFDDVFQSFFSSARTETFGPRFSTHDDGQALVIRAEVPGLSDEDIQISCERNTLTIRGERKIEPPEGYQARRRERMAMRFSRTLQLGPHMDLANAEAKIENGVLTLTIPRLPEAQPRQIPIKAS